MVENFRKITFERQDMMRIQLNLAVLAQFWYVKKVVALITSHYCSRRSMKHLQCAAVGLDPRTNLGAFAKRMVTNTSSHVSVSPNEKSHFHRQHFLEFLIRNFFFHQRNAVVFF